ncbi:MAG: chemotaxis protein CheA [Proteobacteria bacterium]|nr:chemotaxis protein CheA [Pseudomonadota bacterium]
MGNDFSQFNAVFIEESLELIEAAEQVLIKMDASQLKSEEINAIFRCAHCIKSSSGMMGYESVSRFTHIMENYLDKVRNKKILFSKQGVDLLFKSLDCLQHMINDLKDKKELDNQEAKHLELEFNQFMQEDQIDKPAENAAQTLDIHHENSGDELFGKLSEASTIRVATEKIDSLINIVGELVITQSILTQISANFDMSKLETLKEEFSHFEQNCRELQETVMQIRMLPMNYIFNRFPRVIRGLSESLGKKVELTISGENTELDKSILEKIADPLVHLIRNAIDHGIESAQERIENGKPEIGKIQLNAYHQGSNIYIEVSDDGRGLDEDKILQKARQLGLIKSDSVISTEMIKEFIFAPGFSTANKVTDISGRGVGMDVVRKNIDSLGGKVEVLSNKGQGTTFVVCLPLTVAIIDGQLIRIGDSIYVIPLINMIETTQIIPENVHKITVNTEVYCLREKYIPIINLYNLFNIADTTNKIEDHLLVIIELDHNFYGILINEILQSQQVVVKNMKANYRHIEGFAGATVLGNGTVALILDTEGIVRSASQKNNSFKKINDLPAHRVVG